MTGRALMIQGVLAAAGLSVAYATWQREPERASGDVIVVDITKNELGRVHFEDDNTSVDLEKRGDDRQKGVWLRLLDKTAPVAKTDPNAAGSKSAATAAATAAAATVPAKPSRPARDLRGDEPANRVWEQFAPFRSPRAFGNLVAAKLKELGLDAAKKKLQITARGQTRDFVIGTPGSGSGESYLRDVKDGRVYLMPRTLLSDLQGAGYRLVDRKLHAFKIPDVSRIVVSAGGKSRELVITNRQSANAYKIAPANAPDKPDEQARNWHEKIWRLYPTELMGKGEEPSAGTPKVSARVEYFDGAKSVGWVELAKLDVPTAAGATETYARSEHTAGWIRLNNDTTPLADTEKILSGS